MMLTSILLLLVCVLKGYFASTANVPGANLPLIHTLLTESCNHPLLDCSFLFVTRIESDVESRTLLHDGKCQYCFMD